MIRHVISFVAVFLFLTCASLNAQGNKPMTNSDVVKMVKRGISKNYIINVIQTTTPNFDITPDAIAALKAQKVPDDVIKAMITRQGEGKPASVSEGQAAPAKVQTPPQKSSFGGSKFKWEIEFHGGKSVNYQTGGLSTPPPAAETYSLSGSGFKGDTSIRVSSWYFGDGASLFPLSSSLNSVLTESVVQPQGKVFGFRASRALLKWMTAEFTFDHNDRIAITEDALAQIEGARASFKKAWGRLDDVPGNSPTSSVSTVSAYGGHQIFATGAILIRLHEWGRFSPFLTAGVGVLSNGSSMPGVTLVGIYGGPDAVETDTVHLSYTQSSNRAFAQVVGGGVKILLTPHLGIRVDGRMYLYHNPFTNLLDANHTNTPDAAWVVNATGGLYTPFLQQLFGPGISAYSTLSGPALSGFKTFVESGSQRQIPLTLGLFWRF